MTGGARAAVGTWAVAAVLIALVGTACSGDPAEQGVLSTSATATATAPRPASTSTDPSPSGVTSKQPPVTASTRAASAGATSVRPSAPPALALPAVDGLFDYQLGGAYPPPPGVETVSRDRDAVPAPGRYSICYLNAFQTQAEARSWWAQAHPTLLLRSGSGGYVTDPDWPGEVLLDTRTAANRSQLATIVGGWIDDCARRGFQAVEPDNLDSFSRSHGLLTSADNVALATLLVQRAHRAHLAIAQKNTAELAPVGHRVIGFDFAVAEECQVYAECGSYAAVYGRHVLEIEYSDNGATAYRAACAQRQQRGPVVYRDRDLVPRGGAGYVFAAC